MRLRERFSTAAGAWSLQAYLIVVTLLVVAAVAGFAVVNRPAPVSAPESLAEESVAPVSESIASSPPLEMYIPALGLHANFEPDSCRFQDGAINPETMDLACAYTAADKPYVLPGTHAEDIVVLAGHTGAGSPGVFDALYDGTANQHTIAVGDALYLRTTASGGRWLSYQATDLHQPPKEGLSKASEIWGEEAMPGRLLTISCVQPANLFQPSVRNAVVGWQFTGVTAAAGQV